MNALMCHIARDGLNTVVSLDGELVGGTWRLLTAVAAPCVAHGATLTLDCSQVTYLDAQGVRALLELRDAVLGSGARLVLAAPSEAVTRLFAESGLWPFCATEDGSGTTPSAGDAALAVPEA